MSGSIKGTVVNHWTPEEEKLVMDEILKNKREPRKKYLSIRDLNEKIPNRTADAIGTKYTKMLNTNFS